MDIMQIQRINQTAKDLLDKGIATSMEEAMRISENLYGRNETLPQGTGPAGATPMERTESVSVSSGMSMQTPSAPMPNPYAATNDVDMQLRTLNFRLNEQANHIRQLQEKLLELNNKLSAVHMQAVARPQPRVITEPAPSGQTQLAAPAVPEQRMVTIVNASTGEQISVTEKSDGNVDSTGKRLHARVGAYTSGDVAVEKMFYCGGK